MPVKHRRGRPHEPYSKTQDATFLFNALRRRGYTWARALELIEKVAGIPPHNTERYASDKNLTAASEAHEDNLVRAAIIKRAWGPRIRELANDFPSFFPLPTDLLPPNGN